MKNFIKRALLPLMLILLLCSMDQARMKKFELTEGITVKLPSDFMLMSDDDIAVKYPSTKKPLAMFSSADRMVDFGLNVTKSNWAGRNLNVLKDIYKSTLFTLYREVYIEKEEIVMINKNPFIVIEFTSMADHTKKYTYLQYGIFNNRVYIFNFTCPEKLKSTWQPVAGEIMASVKVKPGQLKDIEYAPAGNVPQRGKGPKEILEDQKKRKSAIKTSQSGK